MGDISENFSEVELLCPCCGVLKLDERLIVGLEKLHDLADKPVFVVEGYRCERWNRIRGGTPASEHLLGRAADICIPGLWPEETEALAEKVWEFSHGGIGLYSSKGYVHVDVRTDGPARWRGMA